MLSISEFEEALKTQGQVHHPVLLELGWRRKRIWSTTGQYHRYWQPPGSSDWREARRTLLPFSSLSSQRQKDNAGPAPARSPSAPALPPMINVAYHCTRVRWWKLFTGELVRFTRGSIPTAGTFSTFAVSIPPSLTATAFTTGRVDISAGGRRVYSRREQCRRLFYQGRRQHWCR